MTHGNFYHSVTVVSTDGFFTDDMKKVLFEKFDEIKPAPFRVYTDIAIRLTGCTVGQADAVLNELVALKPLLRSSPKND